MNTLPIQTARTFVIGAIALGVLLFLPAWTLAYWQAWVFIVVFMGSANAIGVYLSLKDPALLERRKTVGAELLLRSWGEVLMVTSLHWPGIHISMLSPGNVVLPGREHIPR